MLTDPGAPLAHRETVNEAMLKYFFHDLPFKTRTIREHRERVKKLSLEKQES